MTPLVARVGVIERGEVGVHEVGGNNHGPRIAEYQASVGLQPGDAWCAAFQFWAFDQAARALGVENPCPKTGGALRMLRQAAIGYHVSQPDAGCLVFEDHGAGLGHVSFVMEVHDDEMLVIAGNSNTDGSRNGNQVCVHPMRYDDPRIAGYLDFSRELLPQAEQGLVT